MREEEFEIALKVVIVGNGGVGKSSLIQRYCRGTFSKMYKRTIGVDFLERQLELDGEQVRLMLWDTAGQEEFDAITKTYYRGAQACVLAFSTTDRNSFEAIPTWKQKIEFECGDIPTVLIQNKIDLLDQSVISSEEAEILARKLNCRLVRTSVSEDINISSVFRHLTARCLAELRDPIADFYYNTTPEHSAYFYNGLHQITINAFNSNHKTSNGNTIMLRKGKFHRKKNLLKNTCRIL